VARSRKLRLPLRLRPRLPPLRPRLLKPPSRLKPLPRLPLRPLPRLLKLPSRLKPLRLLPRLLLLLRSNTSRIKKNGASAPFFIA
jgi:hypothetical protein